MVDRTWVDLDLELTKKNNGDVREFTYIDAIYSSLANIFETLRGSRRMLPEFANNLHGMLFEPIDEDTAEIIGEVLLDSIDRWEPRIQVTNININPKYDQNTYEITLTFYIINTDEINTFNYILYRQ